MKYSEVKLYKLFSKISLYQYINPINTYNEKEKFFKSLKKGIKYNPQLEYQLKPQIDFLKKLDKELLKIRNCSDPIIAFNSDKIQNYINWINSFENKKDTSITSFLTNVYGTPDSELVSKAFIQINNINLDESMKQSFLTEEEVSKLIQNSLEKYNLDYYLQFISNKNARASVNHRIKRISIRKDVKLTLAEINALIVHEIETHILRSKNGEKTNYLILKYGFPGYVETEEGLAIFNEYYSNKLLLNRMKVYCLRVLASYHCSNNDFYNLFKILREYTNDDQAFEISLRVKRGLKDTSEYGGYTKDQIYYSGFLKIQNLKSELIPLLYIGKIGVDNINLVATQLQGDIWEMIQLPKWDTPYNDIYDRISPPSS